MNIPRPIYENDTTLMAERRIASRLAAAWKCDVHKLDRRHHTDWMLTRSKSAIGWAELKGRPKYTWENINRLGGYMLSLEKWRDGVSRLLITGLPYCLVVEDGQGDCRAAVYKSEPDVEWFRFGMGGRSDRGDPLDIEPVIYIPTDHFDVNIKDGGKHG